MILTGHEIIKQHKLGNILIERFDENLVNPNSYDLCLGDKIGQYSNSRLDVKKENKFEVSKMPNEGFVLKKGQFYLGHSSETIASNLYVPIIHAKSGIARLGLFVHVTADLIDLGAKVNVTFQFYALNDIVLYPGMRIAQVSFWKTIGEISLYKGKYQDSTGPVSSKYHQNYSNEKTQ